MAGEPGSCRGGERGGRAAGITRSGVRSLGAVSLRRRSRSRSCGVWRYGVGVAILSTVVFDFLFVGSRYLFTARSRRGLDRARRVPGHGVGGESTRGALAAGGAGVVAPRGGADSITPRGDVGRARTSPSEVFEAVTREVGLLSGADLARMERYETDGTVTGVGGWSKDVDELAVGTRIPLEGVSIAALVLESSGPVRVDSFANAFGEIAQEARDVGIRSSVGCPIVVGGHLWGVIAASSKSDAPFPPDTESQMAEFTELVSTAIANAESRAELRASRARIVAAADETRRRIERDLHDGTQQRLVSLGLELRADAGKRAAGARRAQRAAGQHLARSRRRLGGSPGAVREESTPRSFLGVGSDPRSKPCRVAPRCPSCWTCASTGACRTRSRSARTTSSRRRSPTLPSTRRRPSCTSSSKPTTERSTCPIRDDGVGGADLTRGSGLVGIRDRVDALGGTIEIASSTGKGTSLNVSIPFREPRPDGDEDRD